MKVSKAVLLTSGIGVMLFTATLWIAACTSTPAGPDASIESIEDAKEPLKDGDCLEGEYFDKGTESCEPLEGQSSPESSHDGPIDVPKEDHEIAIPDETFSEEEIELQPEEPSEALPSEEIPAD